MRDPTTLSYGLNKSLTPYAGFTHANNASSGAKLLFDIMATQISRILNKSNQRSDIMNIIDLEVLRMKPAGILLLLLIPASPGFLYLLFLIDVDRGLAIVISFIYLFLVIISYLFYEMVQFYLVSDIIIHSFKNEDHRYFTLKEIGNRAKLNQVEKTLHNFIKRKKISNSVVSILITANSLGENAYSHTKFKSVKFFFKNGYHKEDYGNENDGQFKILVSTDEVNIQEIYNDSILNGVLFPKGLNTYLFLEVECISIYESFVGNKVMRFIHKKYKKSDRILLLGNSEGIMRFFG
jgi:hypothetical protein